MGYNYYDSDFMTGLAAVSAILGIFVLIAVAAGLVMYILRSIGLMTIAKNRGLANPWLVWIPIVGTFTLGAVVDDINAREGGKSYYRFILLGGSVLSMLLGGVSNVMTIASMVRDPYDYSGMMASSGAGYFGSLISLGYFVCTILSLHKLYKCYRPGSSTSWTVLSVIFPFMQSIFPFAIRHNQPNWTTPGAYQPGPDGGQQWQNPQGGYNPGQQPPQGGYNPYLNNNAPTQQPPYQGAPGGNGMYDEPSRSPLEDDTNKTPPTDM